MIGDDFRAAVGAETDIDGIQQAEPLGEQFDSLFFVSLEEFDLGSTQRCNASQCFLYYLLDSAGVVGKIHTTESPQF